VDVVLESGVGATSSISQVTCVMSLVISILPVCFVLEFLKSIIFSVGGKALCLVLALEVRLLDNDT
jgi:hypothetical protein